jgi:hypothetical protein
MLREEVVAVEEEVVELASPVATGSQPETTEAPIDPGDIMSWSSTEGDE